MMIMSGVMNPSQPANTAKHMRRRAILFILYIFDDMQIYYICETLAKTAE